MTDTDTLKAIFEHRPTGWTDLVRRYGPAVRAVVKLVFERYHEPAVAADLDEVVAEVFSRLAEKNFQWLRALAGPERLAPSLRALAAWRALGVLRVKYQAFTCSLEAEAKVGHVHVATAVLARPPSERERAPCLTREDIERVVAEFLKSVGDRQQNILQSHYRDGKRYADICAAEGIPLASVSQILRHERVKLAERLIAAAPESGL